MCEHSLLYLCVDIYGICVVLYSGARAVSHNMDSVIEI